MPDATLGVTPPEPARGSRKKRGNDVLSDFQVVLTPEVLREMNRRWPFRMHGIKRDLRWMEKQSHKIARRQSDGN